ncbi:helix-turn-helix domain-containing protein [Companilactobacillus sp. DQM5]|uniref:helix-turn-helix domain-containing protein n=1 Tax=Companilactobacillus sp. DQM5 TaxID=3463359 RepID=UPI0040580498
MAQSKYQEWVSDKGLSMIAGWARTGLTDEQIANNMGISRSTLNEWKKKYSDISDTLKENKQKADIEVENALYKKALGMTTKSKTYKMVKVDDDVLRVRRERFLNQYKLNHPKATKKELAMKSIEEVPTYERIPIVENETELAPDTSAIIFWLKNRMPEVYRDQSFKELNEAQADKAKADAETAIQKARIAKIQADSLEGLNDDGSNITIVDGWLDDEDETSTDKDAD